MAIIYTVLGMLGTAIVLLGIYAIILGRWPFQD